MDPFASIVIGGIVSQIISVLWGYLGQLRVSSGIFGEWWSAWQPTAVAEWGWVTEKVEITNSITGGVRIRNKLNGKGYRWEGKARLIDSTYLVGEWKSVNPGSNAEGVFMLTFTTDGDSLMGYFMTRDLDRKKYTSGFILGRSESSMIEAKDRWIRSKPSYRK